MTVQFRLLCYTRQACLRGGGALRRTLAWRSESAPLDSQQTCLLKMKWSGLVVSSQQADSEDGKVHRTRPKCKNTCAYTTVPPLRRHHPRSVVKFFLPSALPLYCNPCCLSFFPVPDFFFFFGTVDYTRCVWLVSRSDTEGETLSSCCSWKAASGIQGGLWVRTGKVQTPALIWLPLGMACIASEAFGHLTLEKYFHNWLLGGRFDMFYESPWKKCNCSITRCFFPPRGRVFVFHTRDTVRAAGMQ